jgi:hypothetical protein
MTREGATAWIGEYLFKSFQYPAVGEIEIEFDTDGGTAKVTQAVSHLGDYAPSGVTAPNFGGLINVTPEGVEGFDAEIPAFNFIYHATFTSASLTQSYSLAVAGITKTVNSATWHGFAAGTVFFRAVWRGRVKRGVGRKRRCRTNFGLNRSTRRGRTRIRHFVARPVGVRSVVVFADAGD